MGIETGLYTELSGNAGVSALVGTRIYPQKLAQDATLPALVYSVISDPRELTLDGPSDFIRARVQVDAWADTYLEAIALSDAVRAAINGENNSLGAQAVQFVYLDSQADAEPFVEGDTIEYRRTQDYIVIYTES